MLLLTAAGLCEAPAALAAFEESIGGRRQGAIRARARSHPAARSALAWLNARPARRGHVLVDPRKAPLAVGGLGLEKMDPDQATEPHLRTQWCQIVSSTLTLCQIQSQGARYDR